VDDYRDPVTALGASVSRKYGGTWAASAAPVAGSPFIVMVQQRESPGPIGYRTLFITRDRHAGCCDSLGVCALCVLVRVEAARNYEVETIASPGEAIPGRITDA
jgi:hypothetical protein